MHAVFACAFTISFIIGICTFLLGCNPHIKGQCIAYDVVHGTVYGYKIDKETCSKCNSQDKKGHCTSTTYYDCYDAYVRVHYGSNSTCLYETASDDKSKSSAQKSATHYPIGDHLTLAKMKGDSSCMDISTGMNIWITGVAFLSFCGLLLVVWLPILAFTLYSDCREAALIQASIREAREAKERNIEAEML